MENIPPKILAIDVGGGTQDILLYEEGKAIENCVQMILPSPTQIVARQIEKVTASRQDLFLSGNTMGGGPCAWAVAEHIQAGFKVYATERAALTLNDNLQEVRKQGIEIVHRAPRGAREVRLGDVDLTALRRALHPFGVSLPSRFAIAVQDHGFNPRGSNRRFRFGYWQRFLASGGRLQDLIYFQAPKPMTRMAAVQRDAPGAAVMDTCAAAIWGILCDPRAAEKQEDGLLALNLGNHHTLGALVQHDRIWGIFEHHTERMTAANLRRIVDRFLKKLLTNDEIFQDDGHGCAIDPGYSRRKGFRFIAVTGPQRSRTEGLGYHMAAPFGDMMLTGCFGLVAAWKAVMQNCNLRVERRIR